MQDVNKVRDFWEKRAGTVQVEDREVTHPDVWQRWLEIEMIEKFLNPTQRVIDIGCGNGFTTRQIASFVGEVIGVDYSEEMIKRASASPHSSSNMTFNVCDVTKLDASKFGLFDLAISERCLINLASW